MVAHYIAGLIDLYFTLNKQMNMISCLLEVQVIMHVDVHIGT